MSIWGWVQRQWSSTSLSGAPAPLPATPAIIVAAPPAPVSPTALADHIQRACALLNGQWPGALASACTTHGILTPKNLAAFLSQCLAESGAFALNRESLNYSVQGLLSTFSRQRISATDALRLGRKKGEPPLSQDRQMQIANIIYGGEYGRRNLGNTQDGDGWAFRGAPMLQLTGRDNWTAYSRFANRRLEGLASWLMTPEGAADNAGWFWRTKGCIALAEALPSANAQNSLEFEALTRRINGGTIGLEHRKEKYALIWEYFRGVGSPTR